MRHKVILVLIIICVMISGGVLISETAISSKAKPDMIEINKIKVSVENTQDFTNFNLQSKYDFTIILMPEGNVVYSTKETQTMPTQERLNNAISNFDSVLDYNKDGNIIGKIIIYNGQILQGNSVLRIIAVVVPFSILIVLLVLYFLYMRYYLYNPFKKLKHFAAAVANGNFTLPLPMDRYNLFGEFTESFDLMRTELDVARQKAINEELSKKELIATLSHDIKTPIAVVRAASELLEINENNEKKLLNIKAIQAKTLEMDRLITDLFSSTLEDLSQLKIVTQDIDSNSLQDILQNSDPLNKAIQKGKMPECVVKVDPLRIGQVFGNIIANSYKYAGTKIDISFAIEDKFLKISFKDFGNTLDKEDLLFITNKFFRGQNAKGKTGAGLGLYICLNLLERMNGDLDFILENDGFKVNVRLPLS